MRSEAHHFRIPARHIGVVAAHALTELHERMLDVTGVLFILQVCADLLVGELASKPGVPPEEERHKDDQPSGNEKKRAIARGHFVMRGRRKLRRGILLSTFRLLTIFWSGWSTGQGLS